MSDIMDDNNLKKLALQYLGIDTLNIDFNNEENNLVFKVNFIYEGVIKKALLNYKWSFSLKTNQLIEKTNLDDYKFKYSYILPKDFLRLINPFEDKNKTILIDDYEIKKTFYSNKINPYIEYIARIDTKDFPEYFINYVTYKLASELCFNLTGDLDLLNIMLTKTNTEFLTAKNIDTLQQPTKVILDSPFLSARY